MKCDHCQSEATVQETVIQAGKVVQRHLCEQCAKALGIKIQGPPQIAQAITQVTQALTGSPAPKAKPRLTPIATCPACGLSYGQFRQNSMLGCPTCYSAFEAQLGPLLERVHEGATHHVGKQPKRAASKAGAGFQPASPAAGVTPAPAPSPERLAAEELARRLELLRRQLTEAIAAEQYERAAQLRDQIRRLAGPAA